MHSPRSWGLGSCGLNESSAPREISEIIGDHALEYLPIFPPRAVMFSGPSLKIIFKAVLIFMPLSNCYHGLLYRVQHTLRNLDCQPMPSNLSVQIVRQRHLTLRTIRHRVFWIPCKRFCLIDGPMPMAANPWTKSMN